MNPDDIILLGLRYSVTALSRLDGTMLWKTDLPTTLSGDDFVTLISDGQRVFAHTEGKVNCLDLATGQLLWSNPLKGYGYGLASLALPNGATSPGTTVRQAQVLKQHQSGSNVVTSG
jgi:outer membrane protein assembly factor BamB